MLACLQICVKVDLPLKTFSHKVKLMFLKKLFQDSFLGQRVHA